MGVVVVIDVVVALLTREQGVEHPAGLVPLRLRLLLGVLPGEWIEALRHRTVATRHGPPSLRVLLAGGAHQAIDLAAPRDRHRTPTRMVEARRRIEQLVELRAPAIALHAGWDEDL